MRRQRVWQRRNVGGSPAALSLGGLGKRREPDHLKCGEESDSAAPVCLRSVKKPRRISLQRVFSRIPSSFSQFSSRFTLLFLVALVVICVFHIHSAVGGDSYIKLEQPWEIQAQVFTVGFTNLFMLLGIRELWKARLFPDAMIGTFTMITSFIYHILATLDGNRGDCRHKLLGGNEMAWHRADNTFAIGSFMCIGLQLVQDTSITWLYGSRVFVLSAAAMSQFLSPWDCSYTLFPIISNLVVVFAYLAWRGKMPIFGHVPLGRIIWTFIASVIFFAKGLDDSTDYLRIFHGCWHISVSLFGFYVVPYLNPPEVVAIRLQAQRAEAEVMRRLWASRSVSKSVEIVENPSARQHPTSRDGTSSER